MRFRNLAFVSIGIVVACGSDEGASPEDSGAFIEAPPTAAAIAEQLGALTDELSQTLTDSQRQALDASALALSSGHGLELIALEGSPLAWIRLGVALHVRGAVSAAMWCDLRGLEGAPEHPALLSQLGFELNTAERYAEARPLLLRAVQLEPALGPALANLAYTYWRLGRRDRAAHYYTQAIAIQPSAADWLLQLGEVYAEDGAVEAARGAFEEALTLTPGDVETTARLAALPGSPTTPATPGSDGLAEVSTILSDCGLARLDDVIATLNPLASAMYSVEDTHTQAIQDLQVISSACEQTCEGGDRLACIQRCLGAQCSSVQGRVANTIAAHVSAVFAVNAEGLAIQSRYQRCVRGQLPEVDPVAPSTLLFAEQNVRAQAALTHEANRELLATDFDLVEMWNLEASGICGAAQLAHEQVPPVSEASKRLTSEFCLLVVCVNFDNGQFGISLQLGIIAGEFTIDTTTHSFSVAVGVGLAIPQVASAAVMLKVDTARGVGITGQAKAGGMMSAKYSDDYWLTSNRARSP